jgi:hypothetical protein
MNEPDWIHAAWQFLAVRAGLDEREQLFPAVDTAGAVRCRFCPYVFPGNIRYKDDHVIGHIRDDYEPAVLAAITAGEIELAIELAGAA